MPPSPDNHCVKLQPYNRRARYRIISCSMPQCRDGILFQAENDIDKHRFILVDFLIEAELACRLSGKSLMTHPDTQTLKLMTIVVQDWERSSLYTNQVARLDIKDHGPTGNGVFGSSSVNYIVICSVNRHSVSNQFMFINRHGFFILEVATENMWHIFMYMLYQ